MPLRFVLILFVMVIIISGCKSVDDRDLAETPLSEVEQSEPEQPAEGEVAEPTQIPQEESGADIAAIEATWQASPHADAFVLDVDGNNNTCARCHAPVNWLPSMDDLPESCFTCKFELEDPPPYIAESEWVDIPCFVCHKVDKKDNILPEYTWLEIAAISEYSSVATPTELCQKCHNEVDLPDHMVLQVGGAHAGYECTDCHNAHDTIASCSDAGCHDDVSDPASGIMGHDEVHKMVSCDVCHDANGWEVGPTEDKGVWATFATIPAEDGEKSQLTTSHNIVLEAPCERCHFLDNPWALVESVSAP